MSLTQPFVQIHLFFTRARTLELNTTDLQFLQMSTLPKEVFTRMQRIASKLYTALKSTSFHVGRPPATPRELTGWLNVCVPGVDAHLMKNISDDDLHNDFGPVFSEIDCEWSKIRKQHADYFEATAPVVTGHKRVVDLTDNDCQCAAKRRRTGTNGQYVSDEEVKRLQTLVVEQKKEIDHLKQQIAVAAVAKPAAAAAAAVASASNPPAADAAAVDVTASAVMYYHYTYDAQIKALVTRTLGDKTRRRDLCDALRFIGWVYEGDRMGYSNPKSGHKLAFTVKEVNPVFLIPKENTGLKYALNMCLAPMSRIQEIKAAFRLA